VKRKILALGMLIFLLFSQIGTDSVHAEGFSSLKEYINKASRTYPKISVYYEDLSTGETFSYQSKKMKPAASTIKLPLVLYIYDLVNQNKLDLNEKLTYQKYQYYGGSGVIQNDRVGTKYSIKDLVYKCVTYSDNIAFIMLRDRVGRANFQSYARSLGATTVYPNGQNMTTADDLGRYLKNVWNFWKKSPKYGNELLNLLTRTVYTKTVATCLKPAQVAHKVGYIPEKQVYNDAAIILGDQPYILAIMTEGIPVNKEEAFISQLAVAVEKEHQNAASVHFVQLLEKTEKSKFLLKRDITIVNGEAPYAYFNQTKEDFADVKQAFNLLNSQSQKKYEGRVKDIEVWLSRAVSYIDALSAGKKLEVETGALERQLNEGNIDGTVKAYYSLSFLIKKQATYLYKPYGLATRNAILAKYKVPTETAMSDAYFPVLIIEELEKLEETTIKPNVMAQSDYREKIEKWLPLVKQEKMKESLLQRYSE
jgi:hypothetical protein